MLGTKEAQRLHYWKREGDPERVDALEVMDSEAATSNSSVYGLDADNSEEHIVAVWSLLKRFLSGLKKPVIPKKVSRELKEISNHLI